MLSRALFAVTTRTNFVVKRAAQLASGASKQTGGPYLPVDFVLLCAVD